MELASNKQQNKLLTRAYRNAPSHEGPACQLLHPEYPDGGSDSRAIL